MKRNFRPLSALLLSGLLFSCGNLAGTAAKSANSASLLGLSGGDANSIVSIYPASGAVAALPTAITVSFNSASLEASAASVTNFTITCATNPLAAQSVTITPGFGSAAVVLPTITGLAEGSVCTFTVAASLKDGLGNFINGVHTAQYTLSSAAAAAGWNGTGAAAAATSAVGTASGNPFSESGPAAMALQGLLVNGTQYVDGLVGVWAPFGATSLSYGQSHGASAGGYTQLSCPTGFRVTGVVGRAGAYIDAIGVTCKTADQSQTYTSSLAGGAGGAAFALTCPAGKFATDLNGYAGNYLNQLSLSCR